MPAAMQTILTADWKARPLASDVEGTFSPCTIANEKTDDRGENFMKAIVVTDQAAGAAGGDKRRRRPGPCVGIRLDRVDVALDMDRSARPRPDAVDPRARAGRRGHRPGLWHDGAVGG